MKKLQLILGLLIYGVVLNAQTNTFPASGKVGVGTLTPENTDGWEQVLEVRGNLNSKILFTTGLVKSGLWAHDYGYYGALPGSLIGTTSNHPFSLITAGTSKITIMPDGNVGIGTTSPYSKLQINGAFESNEYGITKTAVSIYSTDAPAIGRGGVIALGGKTGNATTDYPFAYIYGGKETTSPNNYAGYFAINTVSAGGNGETNSGNYERLRITSAGNVGIGTATPTSKLSVNGNIRAKEVKVETANWPDYVFAKSYELPSLQSTEQHIKDNGHLPGIPSASEVQANGVSLGEMNAKLLQKIEELTLHLISLNATVTKQQEEINKLKTK